MTSTELTFHHRLVDTVVGEFARPGDRCAFLPMAAETGDADAYYFELASTVFHESTATR